MSIEEALEDYILNHSEEALSFLIGPKNGLYSLVMKLLAKNGIYRDRFSFDDFVYFLFVSINENREELILMSSHYDFFKVISRITNIILKKLNKKLYKMNNARNRELNSQEMVDRIPDKEDDLREASMEAVRKEISKVSLMDQVIIEAYFGLYRSYILNVDQICSILNVKRSTAFAKIKKFKDKIFIA